MPSHERAFETIHFLGYPSKTMKIFRRNSAAVFLFLAGCMSSIHAQPVAIPTTNTYDSQIPPRLQWNGNFGYCGETSFIAAGLRFGQYCSQFTARAIASPGIAQNQEGSQLLLGVNDSYAARRMRLEASEFYYPTQRTTRDFLDWVKSHVLAGHVVIIGVFNNGILLGEWTKRTDGDPDYDHIVPVLKFGSNASLANFPDVSYLADVITLSDNGLYGPFGTPPVYQFDYSFRLRSFTGTRVQANTPRGSVYLLKNKPANYGIAIKGVLDLDEVTIPVKLTSSLNFEPEIGENSNTPPQPDPLTLTATVTIPDQTVAYNLYLYDGFDKVPVAGFNAAAATAAKTWYIPANSGPTFTTQVSTKTDATAVFRAVPASAP